MGNVPLAVMLILAVLPAAPSRRRAAA